MARILVVDDEEGVRVVLLRLFRLHHHSVEAVSNGAEAIDQLEKGRYDLMIIDRNMPRMSGMDAVSVVRTSEKYKQLRILMVTQSGLTGDVEDAFEAGVDGYVVKPFNMAKVLEKVEKALKANR